MLPRCIQRTFCELDSQATRRLVSDMLESTAPGAAHSHALEYGQRLPVSSIHAMDTLKPASRCQPIRPYCDFDRLIPVPLRFMSSAPTSVIHDSPLSEFALHCYKLSTYACHFSEAFATHSRKELAPSPWKP
ncbi:hypothetical protein X801_00870, partial [Opisthorchis viverrini]